MNVIYADSLFALSVFTDYLLCLVTARFCALRLRRGRYLLAAVLGGVYAVAVFLPGCVWMAHPLVELCAAGLMGLVAFGGEEKLFRCLAAFLAVSASFGGAAWAVALRQGSRPAPDLRLLIGVFLGSYALLTLLSHTRHRRAREHRTAVTLTLDGRQTDFAALEDSGNCLRDPLTGRAVLLASPKALRPLFPEKEGVAAGGPRRGGARHPRRGGRDAARPLPSALLRQRRGLCAAGRLPPRRRRGGRQKAGRSARRRDPGCGGRRI